MERKHEDWIEALRDAAATEGSGERLPEELWQLISDRLDAPESGASGRRRRFLAWTASAAAVAAVTVLGIFLLRSPAGNVPDITAEGPGPLPVDTAVIAAAGDTPDGGTGSLRGDVVASDAFAGPRLSRTGKAADIAAAGTEHVTDAPGEETAVSSGGDAAVGHPDGGEPSAKTVQAEKAGTGAGNGAMPFPVETGRSVKNKKASATKGMLAFAAGGPTSVSGGSSVNGSKGMTSGYTLKAVANSYMTMAAPERYSYRHRQPLTFALAFDFPVGHNLYIGAGVSYTKLSSTVSVIGTQREFSQRLQYVGIPVSLKWAFLNTRFLTLYAGAQGQPEFCVDAKFGDQDAEVPLMQWSASLLAGAQLNLGKHVGIYAEPKLSHYFRETGLETVRNTESVNFNLEFGLRFSY